MRDDKKTKRGIVAIIWMIVILTVVLTIGAVTVSAADLELNLLTDTEERFRVEDKHGAYTRKTEADGTVYMQNTKKGSGALYIYDEKHILGSYSSFSLEGDFYFDSFPTGLRDQKYTPEEMPLSFLCWIYDSTTGGDSTFNALRIDSQGYLYTGLGGAYKTDTKLSTKQWYHIRCAFLPKDGVCEVFVNGREGL